MSSFPWTRHDIEGNNDGVLLQPPPPRLRYLKLDDDSDTSLSD